MATTILNTRIQLRNDTEANWLLVADTEIPLVGEICITNDGEHKGQFKIGDGINTWSNLSYSNINSNEADWNQNDPDGPGYVKNRTHYAYMAMVEKYKEFEYTEEDANGKANIDVPPDFPLFQAGDTVKVIVNGVEYSCVAQNAFDLGVPSDSFPPGSQYVIFADHPLTSNEDMPEWFFKHIIERDKGCYFISTSPAVISLPTGDINYTQDDVDSGDDIILPDFPQFQAGDTVKVTINETEYSRVAQSAFDLGVPSDMYPPGSQMNIISENPITSVEGPLPQGWMIRCTDITFRDERVFMSQSPVVVSYPTGEYEEKEKVEKLPSKYLDLPDWEQNDENGPGYIKNRPFYKLIAENVVIANYENGAPVSGQGSAKICDLPGDLIPGRTYIIESSEGVEELECTLLTDAETVPWYAEIGYPIIFRSGSSNGIAQRGGYVANGEEARLESETWWSKDGPLKITGPLDFSKKLNPDLMNAPVNSVNNKTGNVYLYGDDIIENASAIRTRPGYDIAVLLPEDDIEAYAQDRPVVCSFPYHNYNYNLDADESIVSLGGGRCILCAYIGGKQRIFFGYYDATWSTHIELSGLDEPTLQSSAATKRYVDTEIAKILPSIDGVPDGYVLGISEGKIAWIPKDSA